MKEECSRSQIVTLNEKKGHLLVNNPQSSLSTSLTRYDTLIFQSLHSSDFRVQNKNGPPQLFAKM